MTFLSSTNLPVAFDQTQLDKLPSWANWLAQDADGCWWAYEAEPNQHHQGWYENEVGKSIRLGKTSPNLQWQHALYQIK